MASWCLRWTWGQTFVCSDTYREYQFFALLGQKNYRKFEGELEVCPSSNIFWIVGGGCFILETPPPQ